METENTHSETDGQVFSPLIASGCTGQNAIHTDIFRRALPWSRLMIAREGVANDLNTSHGEKLKAAVAGLLILSVLALPFALALWPVVTGLAGLALVLNWDFARFLYR